MFSAQIVSDGAWLWCGSRRICKFPTEAEAWEFVDEFYS